MVAKSGKTYKVRIAQEAAEFIEKQSRKIQRQIVKKIQSLQEAPHHKGQQIKNSPNTYKIRSGDYRIAYVIRENKVLVLVVRVGHRGDFYRRFDR